MKISAALSLSVSFRTVPGETANWNTRVLEQRTYHLPFEEENKV